MGLRRRANRIGLTSALLVATIGATLALTATPASAAAPVVDLWAPLSLDVTAENSAQGEVPNHIIAMAVIRHDAGTTVNGVRFDLVHSTSGGTYGGTNCSTTASITCSGGYVANGGWNNQGGRATNTRLVVRELPGQALPTTATNSNYSQVIVEITPPNFDSWQNDGPDGSNNGICGIEGNDTQRACKNTGSFSFRLSDGQVTSDRTMTYWTVAESQSSGNSDFPAAYTSSGTSGNVSATFAPPTVTAGAAGAVTISYACDDNDGSGEDVCDSAKVRYRRIGDNAAVNPGASTDASGNLTCANAASGPGCETRSTNPPVAGNFNADDNTTRTYTYRAPRTRGLYVIEANFCNEGGSCPGEAGNYPTYNDSTTTVGLAGSAWQLLGGFYVNESAPTVSFGTTTQTGGGTVAAHPTTGALHPNTGTTLTFTATTSSDTQVLDWNLDQNNTSGINSSGYESRTYGTVAYSSSPGTPTVTKTASLNLSGYVANTSCAVGVRAYDTGGVNASDPSSQSATATQACTTNKLPGSTGSSGNNVLRGSTRSFNLSTSDADNWTNALFSGAGGDEAPTINLAQPAVGTVTCGAFVASSASAGSFPCTHSVPANATVGSYSFTYSVTDSHAGTSATATVAGSITNTPPTATGSTRTIQRGTSSTFNLVASDPDGDTIDGSVGSSGFQVQSTAAMPVGSSVSCTAAGACTVGIARNTTPGSYSFSWLVRDDNAPSSIVTETITVANTAPVAGDDTINDVQRGRPATEAQIQLPGTDAVNGDTLTYSLVSTASMPAGSSVSCTAGGLCSIAVAPDTVVGDYTFTYQANDNNLDSNTGTITVGVENTAPVANDLGVFHTTVGVPLAITLDGTDFNGDTLTYTAPVTAPGKGSITGTGADRDYTAANGTKGSDTFTYTVADNEATSLPGTVTIEIDNSAPTADAQDVDARRQVATPITLTGSDLNGDDLTFAVDTNVTKGTLSCDPDGSCSYTADVGETGTDSFTFVANDGTANSASATVDITITNDDPEADDQAVDAPRLVPTNLTLTASDANNDALTFAGPTTGPSKGSVTCDAAGACTYTSDPGETGTDSFTFTVEDIEGATETGTVTITLTNSDPTATDQSLDAPREVPTPIALAGTDPNGDGLTFSGPTTGPSKGQVTCAPDGSCTYTSDPGETGTDSFTFTADDGQGGTDVGTVSITLTNVTPSATSTSYNVTKAVPKSFVLTGADINNDALTFTPDTYPTLGTLGCIGAVCTYTATATTGTDSFTFTASDGFGGTSAPATVTLNIGPPRVLMGEITVLEPDAGSMGAFAPVTLSAPLPTDVTIGYYTENGSATEGTGNDYRYLGKPTAPAYVKIPAGKTWNATGGISVYADGTTEADETFNIRIASVTTGDGSPISIGDAGGSVTIVDNYRASSDPLMMISDAWLYESDTTTGTTKAQFVLQFSKPVASSFTLNYRTVNGTAVGGATANGTNDYRANPGGTLTIPAGWFGSKVIDVLIWGDTVTEDHETLQLQVVLPDGTPVVQRDPVGTVVLLNDD